MEQTKSFYVDSPQWDPDIKPDDFIVAVGKKQSNSVYHVFQVKVKPGPKPRTKRHHLKVFKSDLVTAMKRDKSQKLIPVTWYSRKSKK